MIENIENIKSRRNSFLKQNTEREFQTKKKKKKKKKRIIFFFPALPLKKKEG